MCNTCSKTCHVNNLLIFYSGCVFMVVFALCYVLVTIVYINFLPNPSVPKFASVLPCYVYIDFRS